MSILPIVGRELVVAARRPGTHRVRFWAALITLGVWLLVFTSSRYVAPGEMGIHLLNALGVLALGFSLFAGMFRTADCLSEEKREGTLGLLFLTDLRAYDVVLGKLVAGSLDTFFGLLAILPILGLTLMLGGVTGAEFWRLALVFVTTLFFSLGIGMFASAISHDARQAMTRALLLLLIITGIFPVVWGAESTMLGRRAPDWLLLPSPVFAYAKAFAAQYRSWTGPDAFWHSLETVFGLGLAAIVAANFILPRTWQQTGEPSRRPRAEKKRASRSRENAALRASLLNFNPIYWLSVRDLGAARFARRVLFVLFPIWLVILISCFCVAKYNETPFVISIFMGYGLHQLIKLMVAAQASQRMNQDRQSGALELLLVTPVPVESILSGQMKALRRHFRVPMILLGLVNAGLWMALSAPSMRMNGPDFSIFTELFLGGVVMIILDFYALCWVGLWQGLTAPRHTRAVMGTILRVMGIPWLAIFFLFFLRPFGNTPGSVAFMFAVWFVVGAVVDVTAAATARRKLQREFRRAAAGRFGNKNA
jgi:ABC-type transport system involved in cytochrome c biogenesis permease component